MVSGPFGTGKTRTLCEAVHLLMKYSPTAKVLVCTHVNQTADNYVQDLHDMTNGQLLMEQCYRYLRQQVDVLRLELLAARFFCLVISPVAFQMVSHWNMLMCNGTSLNLPKESVLRGHSWPAGWLCGIFGMNLVLVDWRQTI